MSDWKNKGFDDARKGSDPDVPEKDVIDSVGLGYSDEQVEQHKEEYEEGYDLGTTQRLADTNENLADKDSEDDD